MEYFKALTLQKHINTVGLRFQIQYKNDKARVEIGKQIDAMSNPKSKKEIDKIIGNSSWTTIRCYICENSVDKLVGLPEGYVSHTLLALGEPKDTVTITEAIDGNTTYSRDDKNHHFVPKLSLEDISLLKK